MESRPRFLIGTVGIPILALWVYVLDSHPALAYILFAIAAVAFAWGIWPSVFGSKRKSGKTILIVGIVAVCLIGLTVLGTYVIKGYIISQQPDFIVTNTSVQKVINEATKEIVLQIQVTVTNKGKHSAYNLIAINAAAPMELPHKVIIRRQPSPVDEIKSGEAVMIPINIGVAIVNDNMAAPMTNISGVVIYIKMNYTPTLNSKEPLSREIWGVYRVNDTVPLLGRLPEDMKPDFKFFIDKALNQ